jgi:hypothetical protein
MVLYIQTMSGNRTHYVISSKDDLKKVFETFPESKFIAFKSKNLKDAVLKISKYIGSHALNSWVEDHDISKSLRSKSVAVGMALAGLVTPAIHDTGFFVGKQKPPKEQLDFTKELRFGAQPEDQFLWTIREIESTGGTNTKHRMITSGPMKGQVAIGSWGLLHPTIKEIVNRMKIDGSAKPEDLKLRSMDRNQIGNYLEQNPNHELRLARYLARHVLKNQKGDLKRSAYSWLYGHNLETGRISEKKLNDNYVHKFIKYHNKNPFLKKPDIQNMPVIQSDPLQNMLKFEVDFKTKIQEWNKYRQEKDYQPTVSSNYTPDPGRIRELNLDEKVPNKSNFMEYLGYKLKKM